jgi:hypothetical protein
MAVTPMLGDWEIPRIAWLRIEQGRKLVDFPLPGRTGSVYQDLGAKAAAIEIAGSVYAEDERSAFLEAVQARLQQAAPMTFVADITAATDIQYVLIDTLVVEEQGTRPGEIGYHMRLRESPPPPPPGDPFGAIDTDLLAAAGALVDGVTAALDALDTLGDIPDLTDPTALIAGATVEALEAIDGIASVGGTLQDLFGSG